MDSDMNSRINIKSQYNIPRYISCLLLLVFWTSALADKVEIASKRYPIEIDGVKTFLPYESSHDLSSKNDSITRIIYSIHSASYSAKSYFNRATELVNKTHRQYRNTLIIAPHILPKGCINNPGKSNILYWEFPAFWGSSRGMFNDHKIRISSYEVTDRILEQVVSSGNFPNIETIVIMGHSAGGQMVNRYAASGIFENKIAKPAGIEVRYIVMAPSSYLYFNNERINRTLNKYSAPENPPKGFNRWAYGLGNIYTYHKKFHITAEMMINQYPSKKILYLVGSKDNDPNETSLDKKPPAMLQGNNRLKRGEIYYNYLIHYFGDSIKQNQKYHVVRGAGHSGRSLMLSPQAIRFTFSPNPKKLQSSLTSSIRDPMHLRKQLEIFLQRYSLPAVAVAVVIGDQVVVASAVGQRKWGEDISVTRNDAFELGSITKPITGTLIGVLKDQGQLDWDTTIGEIFPEMFPEHQTIYQNSTIRQLLSHTSGLPNQPTMKQRIIDIMGTNVIERRVAYVSAALSDKPEVQPGSKYIYSGGAIISASMAEKITGKSWEELVKANVFQKLGMTTAGFGSMATPPDKLDAPWFHQIKNGEITPLPPKPGQNICRNPAGRSVHCSVIDLGKFGAFYNTPHKLGA